MRNSRAITMRVKALAFAAFLGCIAVVTGAWGVEPSRAVSQLGHTTWRIEDGLYSGEPSSLVQTGDGYLWLGTRSGLYRFDGARFVAFTPALGVEPLRSGVLSLAEDRDGSLWIGTGADLEHLKDGALTHFPADSQSLRGYPLCQCELRHLPSAI